MPKGKTTNKILIKEKLGINNIEDLKPAVLKVWKKFITSENSQEQIIAAKEISKYTFPQKREHTGAFSGTIIFQNNPKIGIIEKQEFTELPTETPLKILPETAKDKENAEKT